MSKLVMSTLAAGLVAWTSQSTSAQEVHIPDSLPPGVTAQMVRRGEIVFEQEGRCAECHGTDARGAVGPDLTDAYWWHAKGDYTSIVGQITDGVPQKHSATGVAMPPRGGSDISDADIRAVAAYVWRRSHPTAGDSLPLGLDWRALARGEEVFRGAGRCADCHGPDARGKTGPDLTDEDWLHAKGSYLAILQRILIGVPVEQSRTGTAMPPRGGTNLSYDDVHAVAAYVWALSRLNR